MTAHDDITLRATQAIFKELGRLGNYNKNVQAIIQRAIDEALAYAAKLRAEEKPVGYLPAYELDRVRSGHSGQLRSAKFGPSELDGDVAVILRDKEAT